MNRPSRERLAILRWATAGRVATPIKFVVIILMVIASPHRQYACAAQEPHLRKIATAHFLITTDLDIDSAAELAEQLESTLKNLADYCDRPPRGVIEINVVREPDDWPAGAIPETAINKIRERAGVTETDVIFDGDRFVSAKASVFASSERDSARHELAHAYFGQAFGVAGPVWFAEGMAEVSRYWRAGEREARCEARVADYLRANTPPRLREIVSEAAETGDSWRDYARRWALCHLLVEHPAYADRFRILCRGVLRRDSRATLDNAFGDELERIDWEYRLFTRHIEPGYRVDLCVWDWNATWRTVGRGDIQRTKVAARRGWQASGLRVAAGETYQCQAAGTWKTSPDATSVSADGDARGRGQLEASIWDDELSAPIELGANVEFTPHASGRLMLRCRDAWGNIGDNSGEINVTLRLVE